MNLSNSNQETINLLEEIKVSYENIFSKIKSMINFKEMYYFLHEVEMDFGICDFVRTFMKSKTKIFNNHLYSRLSLLVIKELNLSKPYIMEDFIFKAQAITNTPREIYCLKNEEDNEEDLIKETLNTFELRISYLTSSIKVLKNLKQTQSYLIIPLYE